MNWTPDECTPGDIVRISIGTVYHYGIFVSEDEVIQFGLPPMPGSAVDFQSIKVLSTDIDTFACGKIVEKAVYSQSEKHSKFPPDEVISRARGRIGQGGYHLIHNNCEHFVNECVFGVKVSWQEEEAKKRFFLWKNKQK